MKQLTQYTAIELDDAIQKLAINILETNNMLIGLNDEDSLDILSEKSLHYCQRFNKCLKERDNRAC